MRASKACSTSVAAADFSAQGRSPVPASEPALQPQPPPCMSFRDNRPPRLAVYAETCVRQLEAMLMKTSDEGGVIREPVALAVAADGRTKQAWIVRPNKKAVVGRQRVRGHVGGVCTSRRLVPCIRARNCRRSGFAGYRGRVVPAPRFVGNRMAVASHRAKPSPRMGASRIAVVGATLRFDVGSGWRREPRLRTYNPQRHPHSFVNNRPIHGSARSQLPKACEACSRRERAAARSLV